MKLEKKKHYKRIYKVLPKVVVEGAFISAMDQNSSFRQHIQTRSQVRFGQKDVEIRME